VFVFVGPATFSAGIANARYLKQAGARRVMLVGEPPGDRLNFFAEGVPVIRAENAVTATCRKHAEMYAAMGRCARR
jgi:hypothetical protein